MAMTMMKIGQMVLIATKADVQTDRNRDLDEAATTATADTETIPES
jgi:hypothetical protein